ncbi:DUF721 domain-containing protein [Streptomyces sp. NPDC051561]|uniref:DUF721 domain-containing protein n=1 Tax=Streptomyces sp. NPDC051561 TaxID=3365658 RepID=UPI0037972551
MSGGEVSGVDLARQAFTAAREAARRNGASPKKPPKRRTGPLVRHVGRDPLGLGTALGMMMTERGMVAPAAGGTLLDQFESILATTAPELAGHVQAVSFDVDTGHLGLVPEAPAYGTKLRWSAPKLIVAVNAKVRGAHVRALHVLPPDPGRIGPAVPAAAPRPSAAPPAVPWRHASPEGYRQAIEAHRAAAPPSREDPAIAQAVKRQTAAMRALSTRAFPEPTPSIGTARGRRRREAEATHAMAVRRARAERTNVAVQTPQMQPRQAAS